MGLFGQMAKRAASKKAEEDKKIADAKKAEEEAKAKGADAEADRKAALARGDDRGAARAKEERDRWYAEAAALRKDMADLNENIRWLRKQYEDDVRGSGNSGSGGSTAR